MDVISPPIITTASGVFSREREGQAWFADDQSGDTSGAERQNSNDKGECQTPHEEIRAGRDQMNLLDANRAPHRVVGQIQMVVKTTGAAD